MVRNYLKAENPPWFYETCAEASFYAYRYTSPAPDWEGQDVRNIHLRIGLTPGINNKQKQTMKTFPLPKMVINPPSISQDIDSHFSWARMAPIVTRGIIPSEPHIPFLEHSSMWASKELQPVTEFKMNLKDVCQYCLILKCISLLSDQPFVFSRKILALLFLHMAGCSARKHWKETNRIMRVQILLVE